MKVVSEATLDLFRDPGRCEFCGHWCKDGRHPHHIFCRGIGGGGRLDIRPNLVGLCPGLTGGKCHDLVHAGVIPRTSLLLIVALREGLMPAEIEAVVWEFRRTGKGRAADLTAAARRWLPGEG